MRFLHPLVCCGLLAIVCASSARSEIDGEKQIILLGDSTTIGSVPRAVRPAGPHLEDVIRAQLAARGGLPPCKVINLGMDGEYIQRLLDEGRYDKEIASLKGIDYIFIRYGLNDMNKRENYVANFPKDLRELIGRLRKDHPQAVIIPMTLIAYLPNDELSELINDGVKHAAKEENLAVFDIFPVSHAERAKNPEMFHYRRYPLANIPEEYRDLVKDFILNDYVVVMDNEFDATFAHLPNWLSSDYHPNFAGYQLIGRETANYLEPLMRSLAHHATPIQH